MKLKTLFPCLAASLVLAGCGGSDSDNDINRVVDPNGPIYLVKSTEWKGEEGTSLHFLSNTLDQNTEFNRDTALAIPEYTGIAIPEGANPDTAFYAGMYNESVLRRYVITDQGELELANELDFSGVTPQSGRNLLRATKIMSPTLGYALDFSGLQVIAFNPTDMTLIDTDPSKEGITSISLAAIEEENLPNRWSVFATTDGDRFVATIGFYEQDWTNPGVTKLVIVDSADHSLAVDTSSHTCSAVSGSAKDSAGNLYFASYDDVALDHFRDNIDFSPCMIRLLTGENEFDDSFMMDLTGLTDDDRLIMGAVTGTGDIAYNLIMNEAGQALITDSTRVSALRVPVWEYHSFDLTAGVNATATKVEGIVSIAESPAVPAGTISRILNGSFEHHEHGMITWMSHLEGGPISSIYNATNPTTWTLISNTVPGQLEFVGRLK